MTATQEQLPLTCVRRTIIIEVLHLLWMLVLFLRSILQHAKVPEP